MGRGGVPRDRRPVALPRSMACRLTHCAGQVVACPDTHWRHAMRASDQERSSSCRGRGGARLVHALSVLGFLQVLRRLMLYQQTCMSLELVHGTSACWPLLPCAAKAPAKSCPAVHGCPEVSAHAAGAAWQPLVELVLKSSMANAVACRACSMCRSCSAPPNRRTRPLLGKHPCSFACAQAGSCVT